jgi:hypothetical protein
LQSDPEELVNVADRPANQAVVTRLREALNAELKRTEAGFAIQSDR